MSLRIDEDFDTSLTNPSDAKYKRYVEQIQSAIEDKYQTVSTFKKGSVKVTGFRRGSVIADYKIQAKTNNPSNPEFLAANSEVVGTLKSMGYPVAVSAFAESEPKTLSTATEWYPLQDMTLQCQIPDSVVGTLSWTVNDKPILQNDKYSITEGNKRLTVKSVKAEDKGRYACIKARDIPYIQWQDIVIQPLPNIIVGKSERQFQCVDQIVELTCCEANYGVEWISAGEVTLPDKGCVTLKHKIVSTNCSTETFNCQLTTSALQSFSYGQKTVTINKVKQELTCKDPTLGGGAQGDRVTGPCEKGKEGTITYQCTVSGESGQWREISEDCVLQVIKNIEKEVEVLAPQEIPGIVAQLSTATVQNKGEITQSSVTVQTIVGILVKIADTAQTIKINEPVMKFFLQTVDVLVSDLAINSWGNLNKNSTTDNTSTELLSAVENISDRLTGNFTINQNSIELNRTVADSYSGMSNLTNSATEILIPQLSKPTAITVIVFTTLDSILPTRNASNKYDNNTGVRISGDVVVVKVGEKINNISFAFDINNQNKSLGNPQCVFWNFSLDAWDSTGCQVKPYITKGNETGKITCECDHTTSFSILMSPFSLDHKALAYITYTGVAISMASLILCLIIEIIVWKSLTRNDTSHMRHVSIVNIAVSLLIANICFFIGAAITDQEQPPSVGRCSPAVFFMHFFYLALFFWMLISALLLFYRTIMVLSQMSRARMMAIAFTVGYGAPLLIAVITVASTAGPQNYISKQACWLKWDESKTLLAFVIPALTIVAINLVVLIVVVWKILRRGVGDANQDEKHALMVIARCVAFLTPIFGLTWGFGIGTMVSRDVGIHVVFALLNSLQGFFILVFGTLLDSKVREALAGTLSLRNLTSSNRTRSTSAGPSSSSGLGFFQRMRRRYVYHVSQAGTNSAATTSHVSSSYTSTNT